MAKQGVLAHTSNSSNWEGQAKLKSFFSYTGSMTQHLILACRKCLRPESLDDDALISWLAWGGGVRGRAQTKADFKNKREKEPALSCQRMRSSGLHEVSRWLRDGFCLSKA